MNMLLIGAIGFVVFAVIYKLFFKKQSNVVFAELYELNGGNLVRVNPKSAIKCFIKKQDNTLKLYIPKKYNNNETQGIEIPKSSDYILNYNGIRLAKIIKINDGEFKLAKPELLVSKEYYTLKYKPIERDISFWADNEQLRIHNEWNNDTMWDKIKPYAVLGIVVMACIMLVSMTLDKVGELSDDAKADRNAMTTLVSKLMDDPGSVANNLQEQKDSGSKETVETDVAKPPTGG